jgi:putative flippase GtrA
VITLEVVAQSGPAATSDDAAAPAHPRAAGFAAVMQTVVDHLPWGLSRLPADLLGFAVINSLTFALDLSLLTLLHGGLGWPLPLAITLSYASAFALSFVLNRHFNFRSHSPVGSQLAIYVGVVVVNYLAWILGVGDGLTALGLDYRLARVAAGGCEAVYMYCAMRWIVFRRPVVHRSAA